MRKMKVQPLTRGAFSKYGEYCCLLKPEGEALGPAPVEFYRDLSGVCLGKGMPSISVTQISPRPLVAEKFEYHSFTGEAFLPLDGDAVIHIAPAGKKDVVPYGKTEIFLVPQGTLVVMRPGVWHAAPFALEEKMLHVMVLLPERTYANDCHNVMFPEEEKIQIEV